MPWYKIDGADSLRMAAENKLAARVVHGSSFVDTYSSAAWYCNGSFLRITTLIKSGRLEYRIKPFVSFPFKKFIVTKNCNFEAQDKFEYHNKNIPKVEYANDADIIVAEFHDLDDFIHSEMVFNLLSKKYKTVLFLPKYDFSDVIFMDHNKCEVFTNKQELIKYLNKE